MAKTSQIAGQSLNKGKSAPHKHHVKGRPVKLAFYEKPAFSVIVILIITFIAFIPSLKNEFMPTWDDNVYVTNNPMVHELSTATVKEMFTKPVNSTYVPLPLLTFAIEFSLFGDNPLPYHVTNLLLHLLCTFLVFQFLRAMKIDITYAAIGALLFGIHPMRVESVAWITERKDVLFGTFYLASMIIYTKYLETKDKKRNYFLAGIGFFLLALFSKIEAVTLPLSLLLIDYYKERPLKIKLIIEKAPYFLLSLVFGILGIIILQKQGTLSSNELLTFGDRFFCGLYAFSGYILKFFLPVYQSAYYPYPLLTGITASLIYFVNPLLLIVLGFFVYRSLRFTRAIVFGMLFFLFNVVFLLQIFAAGTAFFSDRFTYIPYIGLIFIFVWYLEKVIRANREKKYVLFPVLAIVVLVLIGLTFSRSQVWKDGETLWTDSLEKYPDRNVPAYANLGVFYGNASQWDKAIAHLTKAIDMDPKYPDAFANRGVAYGNVGEPEKAISDFSKTIEINPKYAKAYHNRAVSYAGLGQYDKAIADLSKAIELEPKYISAYVNLGLLYYQKNEIDNAIGIGLKGLKEDPQNADLMVKTGNYYLEKGDPGHAIEQFRSCLGIKMNDPGAILGMAVAFYYQNDPTTAFRYLNQAKNAEPELNKGMAGVALLENSGYFFSERSKATLMRMFSEMK
jgi:protein O-mannosyl-transferase